MQISRRIRMNPVGRRNTNNHFSQRGVDPAGLKNLAIKSGLRGDTNLSYFFIEDPVRSQELGAKYV